MNQFLDLELAEPNSVYSFPLAYSLSKSAFQFDSQEEFDAVALKLLKIIDSAEPKWISVIDNLAAQPQLGILLWQKSMAFSGRTISVFTKYFLQNKQFDQLFKVYGKMELAMASLQNLDMTEIISLLKAAKLHLRTVFNPLRQTLLSNPNFFSIIKPLTSVVFPPNTPIKRIALNTFIDMLYQILNCASQIQQTAISEVQDPSCEVKKFEFLSSSLNLAMEIAVQVLKRRSEMSEYPRTTLKLMVKAVSLQSLYYYSSEIWHLLFAELILPLLSETSNQAALKENPSESIFFDNNLIYRRNSQTVHCYAAELLLQIVRSVDGSLVVISRQLIQILEQRTNDKLCLGLLCLSILSCEISKRGDIQNWIEIFVKNNLGTFLSTECQLRVQSRVISFLGAFMSMMFEKRSSTFSQIIVYLFRQMRAQDKAISLQCLQTVRALSKNQRAKPKLEMSLFQLSTQLIAIINTRDYTYISFVTELIQQFKLLRDRYASKILKEAVKRLKQQMDSATCDSVDYLFCIDLIQTIIKDNQFFSNFYHLIEDSVDELVEIMPALSKLSCQDRIVSLASQILKSSNELNIFTRAVAKDILPLMSPNDLNDQLQFIWIFFSKKRVTLYEDQEICHTIVEVLLKLFIQVHSNQDDFMRFLKYDSFFYRLLTLSLHAFLQNYTSIAVKYIHNLAPLVLGVLQLNCSLNLKSPLTGGVSVQLLKYFPFEMQHFAKSNRQLFKLTDSMFQNTNLDYYNSNLHILNIAVQADNYNLFGLSEDTPRQAFVFALARRLIQATEAVLRPKLQQEALLPSNNNHVFLQAQSKRLEEYTSELPLYKLERAGLLVTCLKNLGVLQAFQDHIKGILNHSSQRRIKKIKRIL